LSFAYFSYVDSLFSAGDLCRVFAANIESGSYDDRDVERVRTNDQYLSCFVRSFYRDGSMDVALTKLDTVLTFRKTISLNGELMALYGCLCEVCHWCAGV